jgi:multifunctional 2-oxoglutarate metabolism enzyme
VSEFVFGTLNAAFVQVMYEQYLRDPQSVGAEWRELFDNGRLAELPVIPAAAAPVAAGDRQPKQGVVVAASVAPATPTAPPIPPPAATRQTHLPPPVVTPLVGPAARLVQNMADSLTVPTATSFRDIAVDVLDAQRKFLNGALAARSLKFSYTHLIGYAIVQAARSFSMMTHAFRDVDGRPYRVDPQGVHLGIAVDVQKKDGSHALVVPVIKGADGMDFAGFHAAYETLIQKARANRLVPDDFSGGTMTLTNPGTLGTIASVPRLMKGQGSIIAAGAIRQIGPAKVMTITSTYDHRVIQGAESGLFLGRLEGLLQGEEGFYDGIQQSLGLTGRGRREAGSVSVPKATLPSSRFALPGSAPASLDDLKHVAAAMALVKAIRSFGHLAARLDPLGSAPPGDPALDPGPLGLTPENMAQIPAEVLRIYVPGQTFAEAYPALHEIYCGTIAYEFEHIGSHQERLWLRQVIEAGEHRKPLTPDEQRRLLARLTAVETLEQFLHRTYLGQKRFSIEGLDVLVPMLDLTIELAGTAGARRVVMGMAHRGRLNVLAHVVGLPYETIFAEFEGGRHVEDTLTPAGGTGDVKYHHGAEGVYQTISGKPVNVTLTPNPSHLEAVNPVVEGRARAGQTNRRGKDALHDGTVALPVLIHGDASFAAQGVVAETFNLARLKGYTTGGTIHLITNNQLGFTTDPKEARSTDYASDLAKGFDVPIIHVNADDPEACLDAVQLAMMYRDRFHGDVVIDIVGYRRYGHNEGDEPSYTQPAMYERIKQTPTVRQRYVERLTALGVVDAPQAAAEAQQLNQRMGEIQQSLRAHLTLDVKGEEPRRISGGQGLVEPDTRAAAQLLTSLNDQLLAVPPGFTINPKLKKQLERRRTALTVAEIEWAHAEALALATLVHEGVAIRLTGQDTERGTFSQRHMVLHDAVTGERYAPIQNLPGARAPFELYNSPLSEFGCLGFEYGYAAAAPDTLVLWEAQFGDFVNAAEVIIDQFLIAGLAKWGQTSRLTLLLPHGYEGQGPEHSSARIERFLALGADGNLRIANCSTPAQYFHLLRRQARHSEMRPLVLFTPKSLLRLHEAASRLDELTNGAFNPVLDDVAAASRRDAVRRLVLCTGKVYYDLILSPAREAATRVAIARVELLYPFPAVELAQLVERYPNLREIVWVQEEPRNMGPQKFMLPQLRDIVPATIVLSDIGRPERSSPAEGYPAAHVIEQARIVAAAFA